MVQRNTRTFLSGYSRSFQITFDSTFLLTDRECRIRQSKCCCTFQFSLWQSSVLSRTMLSHARLASEQRHGKFTSNASVFSPRFSPRLDRRSQDFLTDKYTSAGWRVFHSAYAFPPKQPSRTQPPRLRQEEKGKKRRARRKMPRVCSEIAPRGFFSVLMASLLDAGRALLVSVLKLPRIFPAWRNQRLMEIWTRNTSGKWNRSLDDVGRHYLNSSLHLLH